VNVLDYIEDELLSCLCNMLATEGRPACACHHYGGEEPPVGDRCSSNDAGKNGQVWVRRVQASLTAEREDVTFAGAPCGGIWQAVIELGIYRCISAVPGDDGTAPPVEHYDADRDLLAADRATLAQVLCCWPLGGDAPVPPPIQAGVAADATDPTGMTVEVTWNNPTALPLPFEMDVSVLGATILPTGPTGACAGSILTITVVTALTAEEEAEPIWVSGPAGGG
jgi:hypothetical protein